MSAATISTTARIVTTPTAVDASTGVTVLLGSVVEYYVEGDAVVCDSGNSLLHLFLRRQQQHGRVEILRPRGCDLRDLLHAGDDALRGREGGVGQGRGGPAD